MLQDLTRFNSFVWVPPKQFRFIAVLQHLLDQINSVRTGILDDGIQWDRRELRYRNAFES